MSAWHLFFSWPAGGTWSNMIASAEWVAVAGVFVWVFRDRLGRRLAAWWHKHHKEHLLAALREIEEERRVRRHEDLVRELREPRERM